MTEIGLPIPTSPFALTKLGEGEVGGGGDPTPPSPLELLSSEWQESLGSG